MRELNPEIHLPERARLRLKSLEAATATALQARRFADHEVAAINSQLQYDLRPETVAGLKERRSDLAARCATDAARFTQLNDRLTAIYRWADRFVIDCHRKHRAVPPFVAVEVDENSAEPMKLLGIQPGKAEPIKTKQQRRAERASSPDRLPGEHPVAYARRMERMNGGRCKRVDPLPADGLNRQMMSTMERNFAEWAKQ